MRADQFASIGLILDSSALVAAERSGQNVRQMLADLLDKVDNAEIGISVVTTRQFDSRGFVRASWTP